MMEIGLIIVLAVMLFPPKELPKIARMVARVYGQVRKTAEDFRSAVLDDEDLREPIDEIKGAYNEARFEVRDAERKARQQLAKAQMDLRMATARRLQAEREAKAAEAAAAAAIAKASEGGSAEAGEAQEGAAGATAPVEAANDGAEAEASAHPPVASPDPRVIAGRRSGAYTPRAYTPPAAPVPSPSPSPSSADEAPSKGGEDEAREGVA